VLAPRLEETAMKRVVLLVLSILTVTSICFAQSTFYYPHIANGRLGDNEVWKTTIFLTNPAASGTATGTVIFLKDLPSDLGAAGAQFADIAFVDQDGAPAGSGGAFSFSIPAGQSRKFTSTGDGSYAGGSAVVQTDAGAVTGTAIFSSYDLSGRLKAEGGVPSATAVPKQSVFVDKGFNVGVAYANPGTQSATVTLSLLNTSAVSVMTTNVTLGPGNHDARFTSQIFIGAPEIVGTMQILSDQPLAAIALRFTTDYSLFTTLPPVTIASVLSPAMQWLEQRPWLSPLKSVARLLSTFGLA
jgi:hypothetical protein